MSAELPKMLEPVKGGSMHCEDCDGRGEVGEEQYMGEFQPPERDRCPSCDGGGHWHVALFTEGQMREYAQEAARQAMERAAAECLNLKATAFFDHAAKDACQACANSIRLLPIESEKQHG